MTRFINLGSISKNLKRAIVLSVFLFGAETVAAEDAEYKTRIHKNLIQDVLNQNFPVVLDHIGKKKDRDQYLTGAMANVKEVSIKIEPMDSNWDTLNSDLFFDAGQIVMEIHALDIVGSGIVVSDSGAVERLKIRAPIELCQIVVTPEQELNDEGMLFPKFDIADVVFQMHPEEFQIDVTGDLPLYKESKIEKEIKQWLEKEVKVYEKDFKHAMQASERQIMSSFAFKKNLEFGGSIQATLSETIQLVNDHMVISYTSDYDAAPGTDKDYKEDKVKLRRVENDFSQEGDFNRDAQIVMDENNINYQLMNLFHQTGTYSLTEWLISVWPDKFQGGASIIKGIMSVATWGTFFPSLKKYPATTQVDFRCSFGKQFLKEGGLQEDFISKVSFLDENKVSGDLHFGCKVFAFDKPMELDMNALMELISSISIDKDDQRWKSTQSVYISTRFDAEFEFGEESTSAFNPIDMFATATGNSHMKDTIKGMKQSMPYIYGRVVDFTPKIQELNIVTNGENDKGEGTRLNDFISNIKSKMDLPAIKMITGFFNQGVPMVAFPTVQRCLGMKPKDSHAVIKDGYAIFAYDYEVIRSDTSCLFDMDNEVVKNERRLLEAEKSRLGMTGGKDIDVTKFAAWAQKAVHSVNNLDHAKNIQLGKDLLKIDNLEKGFDGVKDAVNNIKNLDIDKIKDGAQKAYDFAQENKHHLENAKNIGQQIFNLF